MTRGDRWLEHFSFGGRVHVAVGLLLSVIFVASLVAALAGHFGASLFELAALQPGAVWHGEVWRLVTWIFIESSPLSLLFQCLTIYWFGNELADEWGSRRFLFSFFALALGVAVCTCLVALVDPWVLREFILGSWAPVVGMMVAWGLCFPDRTIRIYFVLPIRGHWFVWLTVGVTVIFAIYEGWQAVLPEFIAEGAALGWFYAPVLAGRLRKKHRPARVTPKRSVAKKRAESVAYLRVVESHDDDPPHMPEDLEKRVRELLGGGKRGDDE